MVILPTNDDEEIQFWDKAGNKIVQRINEAGQQDDAVEAVQSLMSRIVQSGNSLGCLYRSAEHDWRWDGAAILRIIYDAMIQGLYILHSDSNYRARRFLDFQWIENWKGIQVIDAGGSDMAKKLAASPKRAATEPALKAEFDRVCQLYNINSAKRLPNEWYSKDEPLRVQVDVVGYKSEYDFIYPQLCGAVHSSYFAIRRHREFPYSAFHLVHFNQLFAYRLLARLAEYVGVTFDFLESHLIEIARVSVCDKKQPGSKTT
jgi:hypothetical protein